MFIYTIILFVVALYGPSLSEAFAIMSGSIIHDLYSFDDEVFHSMAIPWRINEMIYPNTTIKTYSCDGIPFFGGPSLFTTGYIFTRIYDSLPPHSAVHFSLNFILIDEWYTQLIHVIVNGYTALVFEPRFIGTSVANYICGDNTIPEKMDLHMQGTLAHTMDTLELVFQVSEAITTGSFGIRELQIQIDDVYSSNSTCFTTPDMYTVGGLCDCPPQQYFDQIRGICISCDPSCTQCYGSDATNCLGCAAGHTFLNDYVNDYNICIPCSQGCLLCSGQLPEECVQCKPGYFQLSNNTCVTNCSRGFNGVITGDLKNCTFVCELEQYLMTNGTCGNSCIPPYILRIEGIIQFCDDPPSQNLTSPSQNLTFPSQNLTSCRYPYKESENRSCIIDLDQKQTDQISKIASALSLASSIAGSIGQSISLISFSNPTALFATVFSNIQKYYKYVAITYPPKLQYYMDVEIETPLNIIPDVPDTFVNYFDNKSLPAVFDDGDFHSSFLVNFWKEMITLACSIIFFLVILIAEACTRNHLKIHKLLMIFKEAVMWNFLISLFTSYFGVIILYSSFEFRTTNLHHFMSILSFIVCCLTVLIAIAIYGKIIHIIFKQSKLLKRHRSLHQETSTISVPKEYKVLFEIAKQNSIFQQLFICFFVGRISLFLLIVSYLFEYPLFQTFLSTLLSLSMILYLAITRPVKGIIDLSNYIIQEVIMLIISSCFLGLSIIDSTNPQDYQVRELLGDIIINCNVVFGSVISLYLTIQSLILLKKLLTAAREFYLRLKTKNQTSEKAKEKYVSSSAQDNNQPVPSRLDHVKKIDRIRQLREPDSTGSVPKFRSFSIVTDNESSYDASHSSFIK